MLSQTFSILTPNSLLHLIYYKTFKTKIKPLHLSFFLWNLFVPQPFRFLFGSKIITILIIKLKLLKINVEWKEKSETRHIQTSYSPFSMRLSDPFEAPCHYNGNFPGSSWLDTWAHGFVRRPSWSYSFWRESFGPSLTHKQFRSKRTLTTWKRRRSSKLHEFFFWRSQHQ